MGEKKPLHLFPYENLSATSFKQAQDRVQRYLSDGWTHQGRYAPLFYQDDLPWYDEEESNSSRNFHLHAWGNLSDILLLHSTTNDASLLATALKVATDWVNRFPSWQVGDQPKFAWYDMAVGLRAHRLAYLIDAGARLDQVDKRVLNVLYKSLDQHRDYLERDEHIIFHNNHGFYQVAGQLAMARRFAYKSRKMASARTLGEQRLAKMLDLQFTNEGVHKEHSPDYHRMVCTSLRGLLNEGLIDTPSTRELVGKTEKALAWFVTPDGTLARFGDSDVRSIRYKPSQVVSRWDTPEMQFVSSEGAIGTPPTQTTMTFNDSGYFISRDSWSRSVGDPQAGGSYLAQIAAFHSRAHKHADDLSIVWYEHGAPVLVDPGRYGYLGKAEAGSDLWKDGYWYSHPARVYVESTRAHNTVEIDGKNHARKGVTPYISAIKKSGVSADDLRYSVSEVRHGKVRFIRTLVWLPAKWLIVYDWLACGLGEKHDFRQWFHFPSDARVTLSNNVAVAELVGIGSKLTVLPLLSDLSGSRLVRGDRSADGGYHQGFYSPADNEIVESDALCFEQLQVDKAFFATMLTFEDFEMLPISAKVSPSGVSLTVAWVQGGAKRTLRIHRPINGSVEIHFD